MKRTLIAAVVFALSLATLLPATAQTIEFNPANSSFSVGNLLPPYPRQGKGEPRWGQYLWEFGDGHYYLTDNDSPVQHWFATPGTYTVTLTLTPLYAKAKPLQVPPLKVNIAQGKTNNRRYATQDWVDLNINSPSEVVPEHTLRLIAHYKAPTDLSGGYFLLFFNQKGEVQGVNHPLELVDASTRLYHKEQGVPGGVGQLLGNNVLKNPQAAAEVKKLAGSFRDTRVLKVPAMKKGEQRRIFWDLHVGASLKNKRDKNIEMSVVALWVPDSGPFSGSKNKDQLDLRVSSVYDPNRLRVRPRTLYFRKGETPNLRYILDFQNEGDGAVQDVTVRLPLGKQHDISSFKVEKVSPFCPECRAGVNNQDSVCWEKRLEDNTLVLLFRNIGIEGVGSKRLFESKKSTKGRAIFTLDSKDKRYPFTTTKAMITFQGNPKPVITEPTRLHWRQRTFYLANQPVDGVEREASTPHFNFGMGWHNSAVGSGVGWGVELSTIHHRFYRADSLFFSIDGPLGVTLDQTQNFDIHYLDLKATGLFNLAPWFRFNGGLGVAVPAFARLDAQASGIPQFQLPPVEASEKFGLFQRHEEAFIYNRPLEPRTLPGLSAAVGAEVGLLQDVTLGLGYEVRYFPRFYGSSCLTLTNLNASLRFRILPFRAR
jgi:hypothetical protein